MALIYRAHFSFTKSPRITSKGLNTGAILGFTNTLVEILTKQRPSHLLVAFDSPGPTHRHQRFEAYKAHRQAQPEDITLAIPYIKKILAAFRIPVLALESYEADDIIGTLALQAVKQGFDIYIMTPDKDFAQLVQDHIYLYKPAFMGNPSIILDQKAILEKWNINHVDQIRDLLALQGDASDNIPGIPGIGLKTAQKLIQTFGSIENLLAQSDTLKGKLRENVQQYADQGLLSKELATIHTQVPVTFDPAISLCQEPDPIALQAIFQELEFNTLARRVLGATSTPPQTTEPAQPPQPQASTLSPTPTLASFPTLPQSFYTRPCQYHLIDTPPLRDLLYTYLERQTCFCFDTETTSINPYEATLIGIAFSYYPGEAYYIPLPPNPIETKSIVEKFRPLLESNKYKKIGQNIKYDTLVLKKYGITVKGPFFDTMIAHSLIAPDRPHNIDAMAQQYMEYKTISFSDLVGAKKEQKKNVQNIQDVPLHAVRDYACEDADITLQLSQIFHKSLKEDQLIKLFEEIEMPLIPVLTAMEYQGIRIDPAMLQRIGEELTADMIKLEQTIYDLAGTTFNLNSPKQLGELLFNKLQIADKPTKTKSGQYATHERALTALTHHPIINHILTYRTLQKLTSTYIEVLPKLIAPHDDKIHTSYQQSTVTTGRLSAINPNLQNIPIRTEQYKTIRKAFVPSSPSHVLLSADYSQIELRLMADFSQDPTMIAAFKAGQDIHTITASKLFQVDPTAVDEAMRRQAKTANFGIIYGISPFGLAQRLSISRQTAATIIDAYFEEFKAIKTYMDRVIEEARQQGYITTLYGRRRYLPDIHSRNTTLRNFAERNAINTPIQGTAAEMIKRAMVTIYDWLEAEKLQSKLVLQVHDELVFDVPKEEIAIIQENVIQHMQQALPLSVPIDVHIGIGNNWAEAH